MSFRSNRLEQEAWVSVQFLAGFLGSVTGALLDPFAFLGYLIGGLLIRKAWLAVLWGLAWAVLIDIAVRVIMQRNGLGYDGHVLVPRAVGGILVSLGAWAIVRAIRRARTR